MSSVPCSNERHAAVYNVPLTSIRSSALLATYMHHSGMSCIDPALDRLNSAVADQCCICRPVSQAQYAIVIRHILFHVISICCG